MAPSERPIYFSKYDISDGFWRMVVEPGQEWNFAYVLPQAPGKPTTLVVPSAIQMGWKESPAYFCGASETARDVTAALAGIDAPSNDEIPEHPLEVHIAFPAAEAPTPSLNTDSDHPWVNIECFVDDFILMCNEVSQFRRLSRAALHGIQSVFPPPSVTGHTGGKDSISLKKLKKGDADWTTEKEILGWLINGVTRHISLPPDKAASYLLETRRLLHRNQTKVPLKQFQRVCGKLRFASIAIPAGKGLFSPLNRAMQGNPKHVGLGRKSETREALVDWAALLSDVAKRPTHVHELVPQSWDYFGYCDACASGAGGVGFPLDSALPPVVWRLRFPADIEKRCRNDDGITNSDLEMAGVFLAQIVLEGLVPDLRHKNAAIWCDNTPAVAWVSKKSARSRIPGRLARGLALWLLSLQMGRLQPISIAGVDNDMADVASRSFSKESMFELTDTELLRHFSSHFPLPQAASWTLVTPDSGLSSSVISVIRGQQLPMASWTTPVATNSGATGPPMHAAATLTNTSKGSPPNGEPSCLGATLLGSGEVTSAA